MMPTIGKTRPLACAAEQYRNLMYLTKRPVAVRLVELEQGARPHLERRLDDFEPRWHRLDREMFFHAVSQLAQPLCLCKTRFRFPYPPSKIVEFRYGLHNLL